MELREIDRDHAARSLLEELSLDPDVFGLDSPEALGQLARKVASYRCPTPRQSLVGACLGAVRGISSSDSEFRSEISDTVDALISYGDLQEVESEDEVLLYCGSPAYHRTADSDLYLIGILPDGEPIVPGSMWREVELSGHVRKVTSPSSNIEEYISSAYPKLSSRQWLPVAKAISSSALIRKYEAVLQESVASSEVPGLEVIDRRKPPVYYTSRWAVLEEGLEGVLVARRTLKYGARRYSAILAAAGVIRGLVDLPKLATEGGAFDEAMRLQAAIDVEDGHPQRVKVVGSIETEGARILRFTYPIPFWLQRRWDVLGRRVQAGQGYLFAYELPARVAEEEVDLASEIIWTTADQET